MGSAARKKDMLKEEEKKPTEDQPRQELVVAGAPGALPSVLSDMMDEVLADAGQGTSQAAEDVLVPMIRVLQPMSPECMGDKPEYIDGAEPGDILLTSLNTVIKGSQGIVVQPAHFSKAWVEWVPRTQGGGFVTRHADLPQDAYEYEAEDNPGVKKWKRRSNKNDLIETRYHGVIMNGAPFIIPFASTGHTVSRGWMALQNSARLPVASKPAPSWARKYHLTTVIRSNKAGDWYVFKVTDLGWVNDATEYHLGKALYSQLEAGEKIIGDEGTKPETEEHQTPM